MQNIREKPRRLNLTRWGIEDHESLPFEAITSFQFNYKNHLAYKTFLTQEMLKFGYLASDVVYLNIFHTKKIIDSYLKHLDKIFQQIKKFEVNKVKASSFLKSKICHNTFRRLN